MIEVGKKYKIETIELNDEGHYSTCSTYATVTAHDGNLIQINGCEVINLASPLFHALTDQVAQKAFYEKMSAEIEVILNSE